MVVRSRPRNQWCRPLILDKPVKKHGPELRGLNTGEDRFVF